MNSSQILYKAFVLLLRVDLFWLLCFPEVIKQTQFVNNAKADAELHEPCANTVVVFEKQANFLSGWISLNIPHK